MTTSICLYGDGAQSTDNSTPYYSNNYTVTSLTWNSSLSYDLADTAKLISGCVVFLLVLPFVLFQFRQFPIGSAAACLMGAFLMVASGVVTQHEAYKILGNSENLRTIFLLLGMMMFAQYFEREQLIDILLRTILRSGLSFNSYIWRLCLISFLLSALFTNDACCVVLTPLVLKWWKAQGNFRPEYETEILLLGIATSANIGSAMTIFGNPQMALLAARTDKPEFRLSQLDLKRSLMYIGPAAVMGYLLNLGLLMLSQHLHRLHYQKRQRLQSTNLNTSKEHRSAVDRPLLETAVEMGPLNKQQEGLSTNSQVHPIMPTRNRSKCGTAGESTEFPSSQSVGQTAKESSDSVAGNIVEMGATQVTLVAGRKRMAFRILLGMTLLLVMVLFFASSDKIDFDMGLVPMGGAVLLMVADAALNRRSPAEIVRRVDWTVILMFLGIFVWLGGLNATNIPRYLWGRTGFVDADFNSAREIAALCTFVVVGSNIFSNVPLTIVLLEQLVPCRDQLSLVLYIAWTATVAGNLTLFGSVANLIVAEKAREEAGFHLTFWRYARYGFPSTLLITVIGVLVITALLHLY